MRLLHIADTHLGHTAYAKLDENGYNQRESDIFAAFARAVDVALARKVDAVVHAGDLFDSIRPSNRAMHFAMEQILRLSESDVPFLAIAGNHSSPRLRETGSVFRLFEHIRGVRAVYAGAYERVELGDCVAHCVPHCTTQDAFAEQVKSIVPVQGTSNIAVLHCGVSGVDRFTMGEFNENVLPSGHLWPDMDYVALGHFHDKAIVAPNAAYSGSTERMSFNEAGKPKGVIVVSLPRMSMEFVEIPVRPMVDLGRLDCKGMSNFEIAEAVEAKVSVERPAGKIMRVKLHGVSRSQADGLDLRRMRASAEDALHFELRIEPGDGGGASQAGTAAIGDLRGEFGEYLSNASVERMDKAELLRLGRGYIEAALADREG
jgi:DNA repair exonuclease SbcCD nuclease subunit